METSCAPFHGEASVFFTRYQMNRNMTVVEIISEQIQYFPAAGIGQFYIKSNCHRDKPVDEIEYLDITDGHDNLKSMLMRFFDHDLTKTQIVFDNKYHFVLCLNIIPVISCVIDHFADYLQIF